MGFEVFLNCYERGEHSRFPIAIVESAFKSAIKTKESIGENSFVWKVEYEVEPLPDAPKTIHFNGKDYPYVVRDSSELYISAEDDDTNSTHGFMVAGPSANIQFYESLLLILSATRTALFWPGKNSLVVGNEDTIAHLPEGMIETLGAPFVARKAEQIPQRISAS
jgi:hypothetical protein